MMAGESLPPINQPEEPSEEAVSFDALIGNPQLYRERIMTLLKILPWNYSVKNVQGTQAEHLVSYCLDTANLGTIESSLDRILENRLDDPETKEMLDSINEAMPDRFRHDAPEINSEKKLRRRLLAWADLLGSLGSGQNGNGGSLADKHPV